MNMKSIGNVAISQGITNTGPFMAARIGSTELECISFFHFECLPYVPNHIRIWPECILHKMYYNAGFFPTDDWALSQFSYEFLKHVSNVDVMGTWERSNENDILSTYCKNALRVPLRSLEPYYHENPWSTNLKDKKVLVIHPYEESIKAQYKKRELLFRNQEVLPEFDLITIKSVQSIAGNNPGFDNWFEAYDSMCAEIINKNFDIALIGAGAYGLPLASFVKNLGKKSIHMAGALQILFGIKGKRWDDHDIISSFYNEHWVRPLPIETPSNNFLAEGGCYW